MDVLAVQGLGCVYSILFMLTDVDCFKHKDLLALAARYAGGWSALLAGRQGLLDTSLPKVLFRLVAVPFKHIHKTTYYEYI